MASEKQILANRLNARRSTGPRTLAGKLRSRRNATKHGLTARTVINQLEDDAEFQTFHAQVSSAYRPRSSIDLELISRLASLLWRLRRAHAVETGLLNIQAKLQKNVRIARKEEGIDLGLFGLEPTESRSNPIVDLGRSSIEENAQAFLRLCNISGEAIDRLNRYEVSLWRQTVQLLFLLDGAAAPLTANNR